MKINKEGMTWEEWAYAAAIPEPTHTMPNTSWIHWRGHDSPGYSRHFRKERRAWRLGEDPTEWRAKGLT
jgi:hypothetical protein